MSPRPGVSLVEVLVAAVLLAVGVGGTLEALAGSARLRRAANQREAALQVLEDRLARFERRGCLDAPDSGAVSGGHGVTVRWAVRADSARRVWSAAAVLPGGRAAGRLTLHTELACP